MYWFELAMKTGRERVARFWALFDDQQFARSCPAVGDHVVNVQVTA